MNSFVLGKQLASNPNDPTKVLHICSQCTRTFKDINNFREHLFQEHGELGVNVRQCHMCSYATLLKSKYDCHIRCHLNNRVIRCQKCNYSTINIRHMSKHERQHNVSHVVNTSDSIDSTRREPKRARLESATVSLTTNNNNWSTLFVNTQLNENTIQTEKQRTEKEQSIVERMKSTDERNVFSTCFLTDKLLMPDCKKPLTLHPFSSQEKIDDVQATRSLQSFRSHSSCSSISTSSSSITANTMTTDEPHRTPCLHQNSLIALRANVWALLRMLLPQLALYYPSGTILDHESDHSIDRLVANLIQIPSPYGQYPSV